jgi:H2-forming N5,N10-methylenetetrahydromethanopterin dehydrogenase-like enzyme
MEDSNMPVIRLTPEEQAKVFFPLIDAGPVTVLRDNLLIVQETHLQVLDDAGVQYTKEDWQAVRRAQRRDGRQS